MLLGVSHLHPQFLKRLQITMNDHLFPPSRPAVTSNEKGQKTLEGTVSNENMDDSFEVLLTSDHDFDLFKHMRFLASQQIWIEPQVEEKEQAVRRLLPKEVQIDQSLLLESESVEFYRGEVVYNSAYNWRYFR